MGLFSIGARILFKANSARAEVRKFNAQITGTAQSVALMKKEADKANLTVAQFMRAMENRKAPTQMQKNVKLANSSIRTLTGLMKEGRLMWKAFTGSTTRRRVRFGGIGRAKAQLASLKRSIGGVNAKFTALLAGIGAGIGALGVGAVFSDVKTAFSTSVGLAANLEASRVTFDTLLGDARKSEDLLKRIGTFAAQTPFQRADLIKSSKTLLALSGRNVDENEKLLKLSAQLAALTPGRSVADVALGLRQAKFGEFEILKGFQIALRAEQFKKFGEKGGEAYTNAMLDEVRRQLFAKTGGADLVQALSQTLTGKASTLKDNVEMVSLTLGQAFVDGFDIKGILDEGIGVFQDFNRALRFAMGETLDPSELGFSTTSLAIADTIVEAIGRIKTGFEFLRGFVKRVFAAMEENPQLVKFVATMTVLGSAIAGGVGVAAPLIGGLVVGAGLLVAALAPLSGAIIPALKIGLISLLVIGLPLTIAVGAMVAGFIALRRQGETITQTFSRLFGVMRPLFEQGFDRFMAWFNAFKAEVVPVLAPAWMEISNAMAELSGPANDIFAALFTPDNAMTLEQFAKVGAELGKALAEDIANGARLAARFIRAIAREMRNSKGTTFAFISDLKNITTAFFGIITGVDRSKTTLKTFIAGLADVITFPFRQIIIGLIGMVDRAIVAVADRIRPFSSTIADQIERASAAARSAQDIVNEGFLSTNEALGNLGNFQVEINGELSATVAQPVEIDGEKVAESVSKVSVRARDSGRGGDPVSPEELGFVLQGGTRIQPVSFSDVASEI